MTLYTAHTTLLAMFFPILLAVSSTPPSERSAAGHSSAGPASAAHSAQGPLKTETATLGGGCFWCVEAIYEEIRGVLSVESGYSGGSLKHPTYAQVVSGTTGHAEVVRIVFDPSIITYEEILNVFWHTHDPTTLNRQGADVGPQYRSVVFYHNDAQKAAAQKVLAAITADRLWEDPIVTEISPLVNYYKAENYHQDYFANNASAPYCSFVIAPKLAKFKKEFAHLLKAGR